MIALVVVLAIAGLAMPLSLVPEPYSDVTLSAPGGFKAMLRKLMFAPNAM